MLGRSFSSTSYRYGFNGKEDDAETGYQDYGMRQYNPRLGRFFSVDPITGEYPYLTPYQFASNIPILNIDIDGLEGLPNSTYSPKLNDAYIELGDDFGNYLKSIDARAKSLNRVYTLVTKEEPSIWQKAGHYIEALTYKAGPYTDAEDVSVIKDGKTADGRPATSVDYVAASGGLFIPFISGGAVKKILKNFYRVMEGTNADAFFTKRGVKTWDEFYEKARKAAPGERVSEYKEAGERVAEGNAWSKDSKLSKKYNRDVYKDKEGTIYSLDTQHGEFEVLNDQGKHQGAVDFNGVKTKEADKSGKHNLDVK